MQRALALIAILWPFGWMLFVAFKVDDTAGSLISVGLGVLLASVVGFCVRSVLSGRERFW